MDSKWDKRFLELAKHISSWSKDPSTQVGCVIADDNKKVVALGYNGFPHGIADTPERLNDRPTKYKYVVHSEPNALANAGVSVRGCTIYTYPFAPCSECMKLIITNGIKRVVYPAASAELRARWGESLKFAEDMAKEAGLELQEIPNG
jgi:dCMP deaminase